MIACEILMMSTIIILALLSGYADCRTSQVPNRLLLPFATSALVLNTLYYTLWADTWFSAFCINLVFLTGSAILLYAYHIWAAGDSKLLIVISLFMPGRYLSFVKLGAVPGFMILVIAFIIAFLYIIAESVILAIREHSMVRNPAPFRFDWKSWLNGAVLYGHGNIGKAVTVHRNTPTDKRKISCIQSTAASNAGTLSTSYDGGHPSARL